MKTKWQENGWLKIGGINFEDDPYMELDYGYNLKNCETIYDILSNLRTSFFLLYTVFVKSTLICFYQFIKGYLFNIGLFHGLNSCNLLIPTRTI